MEEVQKTQDYAAERERRKEQQPYEGNDRRKASGSEELTPPGRGDMPVSPEDGTRRG